MRRTAITWYLAASLGACYVGPKGAPAVSYSALTTDQNLKVPRRACLRTSGRTTTSPRTTTRHVLRSRRTIRPRQEWKRPFV